MPPPSPTPVVLLGNSPRVGKFVAAKLMPEYEGMSEFDSIWRNWLSMLTRGSPVIHFVSNIDQAKADMSVIMDGGEPPRDPSHVASYNFSQLPKHIIFGKGFQWPELQRIRELPGSEEWGLCWYYAPMPPGSLPPQVPDMSQITDGTLDKQTNIIVPNMKRVIDGVVSEGKEGLDGVYSLSK